MTNVVMVLGTAVAPWLRFCATFPGGKGGRCIGLTLPSSCAVVMKSGKLNFLEPSGPLQAFNGIAFTLVVVLAIMESVSLYEICVPSNGTHFAGGWVGPRAGLDGYDNSRLHPLEFDPRTVQSVVNPYIH